MEVADRHPKTRKAIETIKLGFSDSDSYDRLDSAKTFVPNATYIFKLPVLEGDDILAFEGQILDKFKHKLRSNDKNCEVVEDCLEVRDFLKKIKKTLSAVKNPKLQSKGWKSLFIKNYNEKYVPLEIVGFKPTKYKINLIDGLIIGPSGKLIELDCKGRYQFKKLEKLDSPKLENKTLKQKAVDQILQVARNK